MEKWEEEKSDGRKGKIVEMIAYPSLQANVAREPAFCEDTSTVPNGDTARVGQRAGGEALRRKHSRWQVGSGPDQAPSGVHMIWEPTR